MSYQLFIKEVGERLKRRRKALGYTQSELVEILNKNCTRLMTTIYLISKCPDLKAGIIALA